MRQELRTALEFALKAANATAEERTQIFSSVQVNAQTSEKLVTSKIAAQELECCVVTLRRWEKEGKLHAVRRSKRSIRWKMSEVTRLKMEGAL